MNVLGKEIGKTLNVILYQRLKECEENGCKCVELRDGQWHCCDCHRCFPSTARVSYENGKSVTMFELQIGDRVQTGIKSVKISTKN